MNLAKRSCLKIVMADRDRRMQDLARSFLQAGGHSVHGVEDGHAALAAVQATKPDLLISEILLPKLDGLALCRAVKKDKNLSQTRVLILSILSARFRSEEAGADGYLAKPLSRGGLMAAVNFLVGQIQPQSRP